MLHRTMMVFVNQCRFYPWSALHSGSPCLTTYNKSGVSMTKFSVVALLTSCAVCSTAFARSDAAGANAPQAFKGAAAWHRYATMDDPGVAPPRVMDDPGVAPPRVMDDPGVAPPRVMDDPGVAPPRVMDDPGVAAPRRG